MQERQSAARAVIIVLGAHCSYRFTAWAAGSFWYRCPRGTSKNGRGGRRTGRLSDLLVRSASPSVDFRCMWRQVSALTDQRHQHPQQKTLSERTQCEETINHRAPLSEAASVHLN